MSSSNRPTISTAEKQKVLLRDNGKCRFPGCNQPLMFNVTFLDDRPDDLLYLGTIAHIRGASIGGPRHPEPEENWTTQQLNHFSNLMVLCPNHHMMVDKAHQAFSADEMQSWIAEPGFTGPTQKILVPNYYAEGENNEELQALLASRPPKYTTFTPKRKRKAWERAYRSHLLEVVPYGTVK